MTKNTKNFNFHYFSKMAENETNIKGKCLFHHEVNLDWNFFFIKYSQTPISTFLQNQNKNKTKLIKITKPN